MNTAFKAQKDSSKYIEWIDIAKGIGIILVIAGHTIALNYSSPLYTFHVPLFFLLSGLVYNQAKYNKSSVFLTSKTKQILKPWAVIWMLSLYVCLLIPQWRTQLSIRQILLDFYTTNTNSVQNSSIWFLFCMYVMYICFFFINKIKRNKLILTAMVVLAFGLLYLKPIEVYFSENIFHLPDNRVPFKIDTALVACVFFAIGSWYKEFVRSVCEKEFSWITLMFLSVILYVVAHFNGWTNLNSYDFGNWPLLFYPVALFGIAVVSWWAFKLSNSWLGGNILKHIFLFYGKNSLIIFGFQSLFIRLYLLVFNNVQGLDMQLYANNPIYHQVGSFLFVTLVASPIMVFCIKELRLHGIKII